MAYVDPSNKSTSDLVTAAHWNQDIVANVQALSEGEVLVTLDGGGSELSTGIVARLYFTHAYTIQQVTLGADQDGDVVVDLWKDTHANYPPTNADTITAGAEPTLSTADTYQDGTLTGWTTSIAAGDWIFLNIDSVTTITYLSFILKLKRAS